MKRIFFLIVFSSLILFSGCVPQSQNKYQVAVINAPAEARVSGLAEKLEKSLARNGYSDFTDSSRVRFLERNREMHGYRAVLASAQLARAVGAEYAVYVGAPVFERVVKEIVPNNSFLRVLHISSRLQLKAVIVDPASGEIVSQYQSNEYFAERIVPVDSKVPPKDADPDIQALIQSALNDISPSIAEDLLNLKANYYGVDGGASDYLPSR